jgi:hypothetical protein
VLAAVGSTALVRCYAATEVMLDVRTNLVCETFTPRTQIKTGSETVNTATCTKSPDDSSIGTLTFVPSGDRDAKVVVEVVLAVKGVTPEQCGQQPDKCIFAKRTFSFIEHSSRRLRVVLRSTCLGKVCGPGETCVEDGSCVGIEAACQTEGCGAEPPPAPTSTGGPPTVGPDGGTLPPGPPACTSGDTRCGGASGSLIEVCRNDRFEPADLCDSPALCEARVGTSCSVIAPIPICPPNQVKCDGQNLVSCNAAGTAVAVVACERVCAAVAAGFRCAFCVPGQKDCDRACDISRAENPDNGTTADDCLLRCRADGSGYAFEQNCGRAQQTTVSDSCRFNVAVPGGAECFKE